MARSRCAAARLDRGADAEYRIRRRRDRALRCRQALRAGAGIGDGRGAARPAAILAGLCRRGAAWPAARHPRWIELSPPGNVARLAFPLRRGLHRTVAGLPGAGREPRLRGRVCEISEAESRATRIRCELAAGLCLALVEVLARRASRSAVDRPLASRD